jgi:hypothetical protein
LSLYILDTNLLLSTGLEMFLPFCGPNMYRFCCSSFFHVDWSFSLVSFPFSLKDLISS